ncbi:MAG TPA: hypothetical protein VK171_11790 [Fimbriimonas sp.]|nr:hypothetical protein [Fimbriimonas sp.]
MIEVLSPSALNAISTAKVEGEKILLTCGQLDRSIYEEVKECFARVGIQWRGKYHVAPWRCESLIASIVASGAMPAKNPHAFHPTPEAIVEQLISSIGLKWLEGGHFLEPSAGMGAIAQGITIEWADAKVDCVELDPLLRGVLEKNGEKVVGSNFLEFNPKTVHGPDFKGYDGILMNPPFSVAGDALAWYTHLKHAYHMLNCAGRIACIVPAGWPESGQSQRHTEMREWIADRFDVSQVEGKFTTTGIETLILSAEFETEPFKRRPYQGWQSWQAWNAGLMVDNRSDTNEIAVKLAASGDKARFASWLRTDLNRTAWRDWNTLVHLTTADIDELWAYYDGEITVGQGELMTYSRDQ